jgi:hypothetical protein
VLTFEPLPRELLFPERAPPRISTLSAKLHAFAEAGIGIAYICRFTREFAALSPEAFARRLRELHGARRVLVRDSARRRRIFSPRAPTEVTLHGGGDAGLHRDAALSAGNLARPRLRRPHAAAARHGAKLPQPG